MLTSPEPTTMGRISKVLLTADKLPSLPWSRFNCLDLADETPAIETLNQASAWT
jgi:hypothetical protein